VIKYLTGLPLRLLRIPWSFVLLWNYRNPKDLFLLLFLCVAWPLGAAFFVYFVLLELREELRRLIDTFLYVPTPDLVERVHQAGRRRFYAGEVIRLDDTVPRLVFGRAGILDVPFFVPKEVLTSACVTGSPGSGKTVHALSLACGAIAGDPRAVVVYLDLKGDEPSVARTLEHYAANHGKPFSFVSTEAEASHALNPLEALAGSVEWRSSFARMLVEALGVGGGLGHKFFENEAASFVEKLLSLYPTASTFEALCRTASDRSNKTLYPSEKRWENVAGLRAALEEFAEVPQLNVSCLDDGVSPEVKQRSVDFSRMLEEGGGVLYFRGRRFYGLVPLIVRGLYEAARAKNGPAAEHTPVLLVCDELHRALPYAPGIFSELIALSRAVSLRPVFVFQNYSQVRTVGRDALVSELLDIPVSFYGGTTDGYSANLLRQEWAKEEITVDPQTNRTTYVRMPRIREALLEWVSTSAASKHCFLARVARGSGGFYTLAKSTPPTDFATYKRLSALGWPTKDELAGSLLAERSPIFSALSEEEEESRDPETDAVVAGVLGRFAKKGR